ncbi:preprotein translocase subunit SecE [bacterium BMS3Bbin10]|nr:preprotein translocase subunit SecE [bacterium BMS3Bbin10]
MWAIEGMAKTNPREFIDQVRAETSKVTWPTRKETGVTTVMVMIMVLFASLFFLGADTVLSWVVGMVLGR